MEIKPEITKEQKLIIGREILKKKIIDLTGRLTSILGCLRTGQLTQAEKIDLVKEYDLLEPKLTELEFNLQYEADILTAYDELNES